MGEAFKADQLGSFLRPVSVKLARCLRLYAEGRISAETLPRGGGLEAILDLIERQRLLSASPTCTRTGRFGASGFQNDLMDVRGRVRY